MIEGDPGRNLQFVTEPVGVMMAILSVTNPTSTALFKAIVAAKTRNATGEQLAAWGYEMVSADSEEGVLRLLTARLLDGRIALDRWPLRAREAAPVL